MFFQILLEKCGGVGGGKETVDIDKQKSTDSRQK